MMSDIRGGNRLFIGAVSVSLLLHLGVLWWGQNLSPSRNLRSAAPAYSPIEVALEPARAMPERTAMPLENRPKQRVTTPVRPLPEVVATEPANEQAAVVSDVASSEETTAPSKNSAESSESSLQPSAVVDTALRERYLATVLAHIESHKYYPLPARRRGIEGGVEVRFTLDAQGRITDLAVSGGNSLFVEAARAAVQSALPLPASPAMDGFPLSVHFQMIFKLK